MSEFVPIVVDRDISNEALFSRPQHSLPDFPVPNYAWREPGIEIEPAFETTDELVADITAKNRARLQEAKELGMERAPRLSIIAGSMFGESQETILAAALECYKNNGQAPTWFGDGRSYITGSLLLNAAASGVDVRLAVPMEVRENPATRRAIEQAGLNPDEVLTGGHSLGGRLFEIGSLLNSRQKLEEEQQKWRASNHEYAEIFIAQITEQLQQLDTDAAIAAILAEEDQKIRDLVIAENAREDVDAVIVIMPPHTTAGNELIRSAMTDPEKDIDGLGPTTGPAKIWDQITAVAALQTLDHLAHKFRGRSVPPEKLAVIGLGQLVGGRARDLANPGTAIGEKEKIQAWGANPGDTRYAGVVLASRGAEFVKADRIRPARWETIPQEKSSKGRRMAPVRWLTSLLERTLPEQVFIVDVGSTSVIDPVTGKRKTVGNLDPRSLPNNDKVKATGARHGVGPVTGALAMQRAIEAMIMRLTRQKQAALDIEEAVTALSNLPDLVEAA